MADNVLTARRFSKLIMEGRVRIVLKILSDNSDTGLLSLDNIIDDTSGKTIRDVLKDKNPDPKLPHQEVILGDVNNDNFHRVLFDNIQAESIRVAAGPSGLDALSWRRLCTAFGQSPMTCVQLYAAFTHRLSSKWNFF